MVALSATMQDNNEGRRVPAQRFRFDGVLLDVREVCKPGRRVVVLAQEEARMLNHNYIGTEHILLGLIHEGEGVAAKALHSAFRWKRSASRSKRSSVKGSRLRVDTFPLLHGRKGSRAVAS